MKRFVYLALAMLMPGMLLAAPVKKDAAKMKAAAFLQQKIAATSGRRAPQNLSLTSSEEEGSAYYVFKNGNKGFAIVAGDDRFGDVIGYSEENTFDEANMPEALRLTLQDYAAAVKFAQENNIEIQRAPRKATRNNVTEFVKFRWNQSEPYSNMCPSDGTASGHCSTGCMAVTTAMIVAHYKYPETLPGHTNSSNNLRSEAYAYDYSRFSTSYSSYSSVGEMPQFMYHIANLLDTKYDPDGSGATESRFVPTFIDYLGYNKNIKAITRDAYSAEDWEEIIYNELAAGRPVNFLGSHPDLGGHSYLADGYRASDGFFHILWGWGSTCVGYFDMNVLNPFVQYLSQWGGMGYKCPPAGFTSGLKAVIGIQPETIEGSNVQLMTTDDIIMDGSERVRATLFNWDDRTFRGQLTWAVLNEDGSFTVLENAPTQNLNVSYKSYANNSLNITSLGLSAGSYKLVPVCKTNDEGAEWNLCEGYQQKYVEVVVNGGKTTITPHPVKDVTAEMLTYKGSSGVYLELLLKLKNNGDDTFGYLTITGTRDDGVKVYGTKMDIATKAGQDLLLSMFIENGGTSSLDYSGHIYTVKVEYLHKTIGTFTIDPGATSPSSYYVSYDGVDFEDYEYVDGKANLYSTSLKGNVKVKSTSSYNYLVPVKITLKDENEEVVYDETVQDFVKNETKAFPVEINGLKAGKIYYLTAEVINISRSDYGNYSETVVKSLFADFPINVTVGVPFFDENGVQQRMVVAAGEQVDLPANTAAIDFRTFESTLVNLGSIENENCIYIFPEDATVPAELAGKNVVVGNHADKITLVDGKPAAFPVGFTASEATYTRTFTNFNNGGTGGWNTIVLPFNAKVTVEGESVDWFHKKSESGRKFWLYKYTNGVGGTVFFDYEAEKTMQANVPYLLAVPGDKWGEKYDLHNKEFTFHGTNVAFTNAKPESTIGEYTFCGSYAKSDCSNGYKLNGEGDFFELQDEATEDPFRASFMLADESTSNAARVLRVARSETDGIVQMESDELTNDNQPIYNLNGQRMQQMQRGVNIVGGKKVLTK